MTVSLRQGSRDVGLKSARTSSFFLYVVLAGLAGILAIIAILQYRWINQLSTATKVQVRSSLESLTTQWHSDLYGEMSAICIALQVGPDSGAHDVWSDYLQRYTAWRYRGTLEGSFEAFRTNKDLVRDIYIWETSDQVRPKLLLLDPANSKIQRFDPPELLAPLLVRLRERSGNVNMALRAWEPEPLSTAGSQSVLKSQAPQTSNYHLAGWQFDEAIPAIVHPLVHHYRPGEPPDAGYFSNDAAVDWIVVVLDPAVIKEKILPDLAARYFGSDRGLEYKLAVVAAGTPQRVLYSSDESFPDPVWSSSDVVMNIFGQPEERKEPETTMPVRREGKSTVSGPSWFPIIQYGPGVDPWVLILQRRSGSLEMVAKQVWRTNLAAGLGFLILLAVNVALVVLATRRLQRLAELQMNFVASISHELRTPLTVISSAADNIADGLVEGKPQVEKYGLMIREQTRQLTDLVDQILLFVSAREGRDQYDLQPLEVDMIVRKAVNNTAYLVQRAGFTLEQDIEPGLPCVCGDMAALPRCLQNLIVNAVKYSGDSRWIGVRARLHRGDEGRQEIKISVSDTGIGISGSDLAHIFKPFYRSPRASAAQIAGTGLGLSLAERIAEVMGGSLSVVSEVGRGSIFTLTLPVLDDNAKPVVNRL